MVVASRRVTYTMPLLHLICCTATRLNPRDRVYAILNTLIVEDGLELRRCGRSDTS